MVSEADTRMAIEELKALINYINERAAYLDKTINPGVMSARDDSHKGSAQQQAAYEKGEATPRTEVGDLQALFWRPTKSGNGEYVNKSQVPEWVDQYPDITTREGSHVDGYVYKLFDSGVLWRKKA